MYINGWGATTNCGIALRWLKVATSQGFGRAYHNLGILYLRGQGVHQDYAEAFSWFQKGAAANDSGAQTNLGYMYDRGLACVRERRMQCCGIAKPPMPGILWERTILLTCI